MCGLSWLAALWWVNEERTEFDGQSRPDQADPPGDLWAGVIDPAAGGMHEQRLRLEKHGEHLRAAAVRQQLLFSGEPLGARGTLQQVGEDHGSVVTAQEVPLSAAQRQEGEVLVTPGLIGAQAAEEENQEVFVWKNKRTSMVNNQETRLLNGGNWNICRDQMFQQSAGEETNERNKILIKDCAE